MTQATRQNYVDAVVNLVAAKATVSSSNAESVRGVSVTPAAGTCTSSRRGRRLSDPDTALQADITAVIDLQEANGEAIKTAVTEYIDDGDMSAAVINEITTGGGITGIDDSVAPTVTVTKAVVVDDTPDNTPSTGTTSGAAAMVVGHIGALLATYLYVSL